MLVKIADIEVVPEAQPRVALDTAIVEEYAEALQGGAEFPPVIAFFDGDRYWLADGFHRLAAYRAIGAQAIPVDRRTGGRRDAILFSCGANAAHGLRRTNADKRRAVETLLRDEEWGGKSDRWISERACVGNQLVGHVRAQLCDSHITTREGRDGKVRALPRKGAGDSTASALLSATERTRPLFSEGTLPRVEPASVVVASPANDAANGPDLFSDLVESFPCLRGIPGARPFDLDRIAQWYVALSEDRDGPDVYGCAEFVIGVAAVEIHNPSPSLKKCMGYVSDGIRITTIARHLSLEDRAIVARWLATVDMDAVQEASAAIGRQMAEADKQAREEKRKARSRGTRKGAGQ